MESKIIKSKLTLALNSPTRFTLLEDGWIKDDFTGLDFGPSSQESMDLEDAIKYCQEQGGRLPEIEELYSLVNKAKYPCVYSIFKDTKTDDWYWSGTKTSWNSSARWVVGFYYGGVGSFGEVDGGYVRPVRPSQC